jgi:PAS domain S-box-containing protein
MVSETELLAAQVAPKSLAFLTGGGEMGARIRAHEWSKSPLGPPETWPQSLRSALSICLSTTLVSAIHWGPELCLLYNDAYAPALAERHPGALGRSVHEVWADIWDVLGPQISAVLASGVGFSTENQLLRMERRGRVEDTWWVYSFAPIRGEEDAVAGVFVTALETTAQVRADQRQSFRLALEQVLRDLADPEDVVAVAAEMLRRQLGAADEADLTLVVREGAHAEATDRRSAKGLRVELREPHRWTDEDRALADEVAERTWAAVGRARANAALAESEARLGFLDRLGAATASLADADAVLAVTTRLLGEHLGLSVCAYADMDDDQNGFTIRGDWAAPGSTSIVGHYSLADFGRLAVANLSGGLPLVVNDNLRELAPEEAATFQNIGIAATICMPLVKEGRLTALMAIHDRAPRTWSEAELNLLREVTSRSWAHVERFAAVAELRASEARFRLTADAVPQIVWITDAEGRLEFYNKQWSDYMGAPAESCATAADVAADHVHPDDSAATMEAFEAARRSGGPYMIEHRIRSKSGDYRWFLVRGEPHRDPQTGDIVRWFGSSVDIDDRRRAEAALRQSEARLTRALDAGELGAWEMDLTSLTTWRSPQHDRIFGYEPPLPEWTYNQFLEHVVADDREQIDAAFQSAVASRERWEFEGRIIRSDGEQRWIWAQGRVDSDADGDPGLMKGMVRDVTERHRADEAVRESEARLRAVLDAAPVGLVFADASGAITGSNVQVESIIGRPVVRSGGADEYGEDYVAFHVDGRRVEGHEYPLAQVLRGDAQRAELEVQVELPDGSLRWVRYIATPMRDERGAIVGGVAASLDVDREKRFADELAREVERAVAELDTAQQQLRQSQKLEAMGQLTGGVAHDFNNLLTPIVGSLDMLVRRGVGSERERRLIDGALQSAERAKTLVQRLLAFARRQPLQPSAVDMKRLVRGMAELISSTLGPTVEVRVELPDDLPPAVADANQLEMAILNLAVNARDAMPQGGVLTIAAVRESVRSGHGSKLGQGHYVRLSVRDTGTGMDEATLARAVEPFFSTKGVGKGTGLGLSMVHGLALQLNGGLTISSHPGAGTTIDLWLPISSITAEMDDGAALAVPARDAVGVALLVDDEDLVRMSTADMLMDLGYEVVEAGSAEDALRLVGEGLAPDLLVTDHLMPGMSGAQLARKLRVHRPELPVLIVSGYAEAEGVDPDLPRLTKPFRNAELAASLAALLGPNA